MNTLHRFALAAGFVVLAGDVLVDVALPLGRAADADAPVARRLVVDAGRARRLQAQAHAGEVGGGAAERLLCLGVDRAGAVGLAQDAERSHRRRNATVAQNAGDGQAGHRHAPHRLAHARIRVVLGQVIKNFLVRIGRLRQCQALFFVLGLNPLGHLTIAGRRIRGRSLLRRIIFPAAQFFQKSKHISAGYNIALKE